MKRIITLSLSLAIALGFFSCKNSVDIVKRHYSNGFYVSHAKKTHSLKDEVAKNSSAKKSVKHDELNGIPVKTAVEKKTNVELTASIKNSPEQLNTRSNSFHKNVDKALSVSAKNHKFNLKHKKNLSSSTNSVTRGGSDNAILLVVCCIFIPPLAVYLKDGSITTNFWIDLILTLLFFLPGIIFAFLVCFDVINLG